MQSGYQGRGHCPIYTNTISNTPNIYSYNHLSHCTWPRVWTRHDQRSFYSCNPYVLGVAVAERHSGIGLVESLLQDNVYAVVRLIHLFDYLAAVKTAGSCALK